MRVKSISARPEPSGLFGKANGKYNCSWVKPGSDDKGLLLNATGRRTISLTNSSEQPEEKGCPYNNDVKNADWYSVEILYSWEGSPTDRVIKGELGQGRSTWSRFKTEMTDQYIPLPIILLLLITFSLWQIMLINWVKASRSDKTGLNKKGIGIGLSVVLIALTAVGLIAVQSGQPVYAFVIVPAIALTVLIIAAIYAARKKAKLPVIPLIALITTLAVEICLALSLGMVLGIL